MKAIRILICLIALAAATLVYAAVHPDTERINKLLDNLPKPETFDIQYKQIVGSQGTQRQWHMGESPFWIRLHPKEKYDIDKLNKDKKYQVKGIILEQNYGVVDFWVREIKEK
jgi:hypothetical protein